jgi:hypothetical protein
MILYNKNCFFQADEQGAGQNIYFERALLKELYLKELHNDKKQKPSPPGRLSIKHIRVVQQFLNKFRRNDLFDNQPGY